MTFELQHTDDASDARAGVITTDHGQILTPIFMPVGTEGAVKAVHFDELREEIKAQIILGNTYHLYLRPGLDVLRAAGGLHGFNGWERPILTDSGGFQVFSLTGIRKLSEEGCEFRSHIDESKHFFTPENVMDTERIIGADIMMALDECPPGLSDYTYAKNSLAMTQRWLDRCIKRFDATEPLYGYRQSLFPIVQGCTYKDLRVEAAKFVADKGADGNAIGGLAVGEPTEVMYEMIEVVNAIPHGGGHPAEHIGGHRAWRRYVRLCHADTQRPKRHALHLRGNDEHAKQEVGDRLLAARRRRMPYRQGDDESLPPPPLQG